MAETVVIDIEARYRDQTSSGVRGTTEDVERLRRKLADTGSAGDKARASMEKIVSTAKTIAKTAVSIPIKVIDYATKPIRSLLNYATSLKGILTGIVMGQATQKLFVAPTQYAETLKTHSLAFENLLGSAEKADQMIKDIQAFDEKSPFNTMQIIEQSRMLMTYKLANEKNVLQMIETIGDAAMGVGAGDEGIERIVRALGQMKAKGKVSAEEMLQLSEVNISGWQYLADAMGVSTAKVQEMTSKNKIPVDTAINALIEGMRKDFGGMANTNASKTLSGVWGQITSVLENGPYLQWGKGLDEGAMQMATKLSGWLEESKEGLEDLGDAGYELGRTMSTYAAQKFIDFGESVKSVLNSDEFKNADTMTEKLKIAWDKVIAEPFTEWWNSKGLAFVGDVADKIGTGLGKFYKGTILTVLGINVDSVAEDGLSVGAKFAQGFLEGFDPDTVWNTVKDAFGRMIMSAGKLFPGGQKADAGSWLSAILLGVGAGKLIGTFGPAVSGIGGLIGNAGGAAAGSAGALALGKLFTGGGAALSGGILGKLGAVGAAGPMTAGSLGAIGVAGAAGLAFGGLGAASAIADLIQAVETRNASERSDMLWTGGSKLGMVGLGAAIGTAILPGLGSAIGAGIGGIGALVAGKAVGEGISGWFDGSGKIDRTMESIRASSAALDEMTAKEQDVKRLTERYEEAKAALDAAPKGSEAYIKAHEDLSKVVQDLAKAYPNLFTQYDIENEKLGEKLDLLEKTTELERQQARDRLALDVSEGRKNLPTMEKNLETSKEKYDQYDEAQNRIAQEYINVSNAAAKWNEIQSQYDKYDPEWTAGRDAFRAALEEAEKNTGIQLMDAMDRGRAASLSNTNQYTSKLANEADKYGEAKYTEGEKLVSLQQQAQELINQEVKNALADIDVDGMTAKIQELTDLNAEIKTREAAIAKMKGGTPEYKEAKADLDEMKQKQTVLNDEVEKWRGPLDEAKDRLSEINTLYDEIARKAGIILPTVSSTGLGEADKYYHPKAEDIRNLRMMGEHSVMQYASGTTSAPAGLAWVGENGPELMRMRGGERVYNAEQSRRIAEQTTGSREAGDSRSAGNSVSINLGGISVTVSGGEADGDVVEALRTRMPEIGNELCAMIAVQMDKIYSNMPVRVEGIT